MVEARRSGRLMNDDEAAGGSSEPPAENASLDALLCSLAEQFSVVMSNTEKVEKLCSALKLRQSSPPCQADADALLPLLPTLAQRTDPAIVPLFDLLKHTALAVKDPWPLLKGMLLARDADLVVRSLQIAHQRTEKGDAGVDRETVSFLARQAQIPGSPLASDDALPSLRDIVSSLRTQAGAIGEDPVLGLFCRDPDPNIRALAARILDLAGEPVSQRLAARMLDKGTFDFLSPYLVYTLATHLDLLALLEPLRRAPVAADLQRAQALVGDLEFRRIVKDIGWPRLNLSLDVCPCVLVARGQSIPLVLRPEEVPLAKRCADVQVTASVTVATAHGGMSSKRMSAREAPHTASQFREYNLRHAEVLGEFLTLAPLTKERALKILGTMDLIVRDFERLFATLTNECSILPDVYGSLKARILAELDAPTSREHMSLELTRLVMMFEEPASVGQVQTLHGLKRYLHQKGLQLGFKLMQGGPSTDRTVDILLVSGERILQKIQAIRYSDFEPEQSDLQIPYAVRIVADGFARQALLGHNSFPRVDIFCYGNEVQYFLQFKNHPAFLRMNYAPPLQGGMIDLEYYGVSKYEMAEHPDQPHASMPATTRNRPRTSALCARKPK
jgi:hypothetical protein